MPSCVRDINHLITTINEIEDMHFLFLEVGRSNQKHVLFYRQISG